MTNGDALQHPSAIPRKLTTLSPAWNILRLENLFWEHWLGISTRGVHGSRPDDWVRTEHIYYSTVPYRQIFRIFDYLSLNQSDVVVDIGCGKGRVLCCAALYSIARVIGVDDTEQLCAAADNNLQTMRHRRTKASVIHCKAENFDYSEGTVYYMYHPFGHSTMRAVLERIRTTGKSEQPLRIVYVNPVHEAVLEDTVWLECYARWRRSDSVRYAGLVHPVSFWRTRSVPN
jgi:SAM-dependent methyltransferase